MSARSPAAERGRSRSPKSLTRSPSPRRDRDVSMSRSRSRSPRKDALNGTTDIDAPSAGGGGSGPHRVIVVSGLTKNVQKGHLEEIFGEYGKVTGLDLPLFKVSGLNRGKAALEYEEPEDAQKAVKHMDGGQLDGSFLTVQPLPASRFIHLPPALSFAIPSALPGSARAGLDTVVAGMVEADMAVGEADTAVVEEGAVEQDTEAAAEGGSEIDLPLLPDLMGIEELFQEHLPFQVEIKVEIEIEVAATQERQ
ncbi:hypothetical protein JCM24511_01074 [Saitozyma sp. JCM 24511]|nr:hypothetical protein JCM24511_01074 [Saitozyma sp. JCM 24511]